MSGLLPAVNTINLSVTNQANFNTSITVGTDAYISRMLRVGTPLTVGSGVVTYGPSILNGTVSVTDTTQSNSSSTGSIVTAGGMGVGGNLYIGGLFSINGGFSMGGPLITTSTTDSTSTSTGALIVAGGAGIAKNLNVGGNFGLLGYETIVNPNGASLTLAPTAVGIGAHIETEQNAPPTAPGPYTDVATIAVSGTDTAGSVNMTTTAGGVSTSITVTFSQMYNNAPTVVVSPWAGFPIGTPPTAVSVTSVSVTNFVVALTTPAGAGTHFGIMYMVIG